jgi:hypothetical protein
VAYYQDVVVEYLRADRAVFVNTECCIQLNDQKNPDDSGLHWYCDAVAVDFRSKPFPTVFLCEVSYAQKLGALIDRLKSWADHWTEVSNALQRDCHISGDCSIRPWLFVPKSCVPRLLTKLPSMKGPDGSPAFSPRITTLESVQPWQYHSWDHRDCDTDKSDSGIPEEMWV